MTTYRPTTPAELQEIVRAHPRVFVRGRGTKPGLASPPAGAAIVETTELAGVLEYEPQEFTFTALAGTPVADVQRMLAEHGQYLPCDPPLVRAGATLGGTVAAGLSGPLRYRYGGLRDFILGVRFVDGEGRLVRGGGKVVKNAAGFDLPKLMVGSAGRLGILVEVTFKVFPRPPAHATCRARFDTLEAGLRALFDLWVRPLDLEAVDMEPDGGGLTLWVRIAGIERALAPRIERLRSLLGGEVEVWQGAEEERLWEEAREFAWVPEGWTLVKVPLTPKRIPALEERLESAETRRRYSVGGNVLWLATPHTPDRLEPLLHEVGVAGLVVRGKVAGSPFLGRRTGMAFARRVKNALDPQARFPEV